MMHDIKFKIYHNNDGVPVDALLSHDVINPNGVRLSISRKTMTYDEFIAYKVAVEHPIHIDSFGNKM